MLVLTRKASQSIVLDGGITITVVGVKGNQVRLGITAPPDVSVYRQEVLPRIREMEGPDQAGCDPCPDAMAI